MCHLYQYMLTLITILLLSSCARAPVIKKYFINQVPEHPPHARIKTSHVLLVSFPIAAPPFQTKEMQYVQQPYQISQFAKHVWASPPVDMLAPLLLQTLQKTGYFSAVVSPPYSGLADLRLDTKLLALYQEFQGSSSQVILIVQAELVAIKTGYLLKSQQFIVRVHSPQNTPYGGVIAANQAVYALLNQMASFVLNNAAHHSMNLFKSTELSSPELPKPNRGVKHAFF